MNKLSPFYETFYEAINKIWPMLSLFVVIIGVIRITRIIINHEKFIFYKEFYNLLAIVYILLLYHLLLSTEGASSGVNLTPFKEMTRYTFGSKSFFYNVIGNIVLFVPFGYFISNYLNAKKTSQIFLVSILISLTAELIQFKIGRAFDVDDIILNVIGALIGFLSYLGIKGIKRKLPHFLKNNVFYNIVAILILVLIIVLFGSIWGLKLL